MLIHKSEKVFKVAEHDYKGCSGMHTNTVKRITWWLWYIPVIYYDTILSTNIK